MKLDKILRVLVCLVLVCCLTIHAMIPKAEATAVVEGIAYISSVLGPVGTVAAVSVIALGLWAGANPDDFDNIVNGVSTHLSEIGSNMKDGFVQMLQVTDSAGAKQLYVAAETLENVRSYLFASEVIQEPSLSTSQSFTFGGSSYTVTADFPFGLIAIWYPGTTYSSAGYAVLYNNHESSNNILVNGVEKSISATTLSHNYYIIAGSSGSLYYSEPPVTSLRLVKTGSGQIEKFKNTLDDVLGNSFYSSYDVSLGVVSDTAIFDDVSVYDSAWNANQLRVAVADPENNEPNYKVYLPVPLPSNYEDLHSVTQSDVLTGTITGVPDLGEDEEYVIEELLIVDGYQGVIVSPSDTQSGTQSGATTGTVTLPGWLSDGINNLLQGLKDILSGILALPAAIAKAIWDAFPAWLTEGTSNMVTGLRDILDAIKALPVAIAEALAAIFVPSADYISAKVDALRGEFGFIDSVIATGEFIRDSISGDSGPPVIYVDLGRAPSGNYGSQRVLLTDFSWYAPYKGQVDTVLSAALWAFFGWRVFLKLPGIIGGESGYISDVFFPSSSGRSGSDDKKKGGKG